MLNKLIKAKNDNNINLVEELIDTLTYYKITSLEELNKVEDKIFTINNKILNEDERIKYCLDLVKNDYHDLDILDFDLAKQVVEIKNSLFKDNLTNKEKIHLLIKLFDLTNKQCYFLKEAYLEIINNEY